MAVERKGKIKEVNDDGIDDDGNTIQSGFIYRPSGELGPALPFAGETNTPGLRAEDAVIYWFIKGVPPGSMDRAKNVRRDR